MIFVKSAALFILIILFLANSCMLVAVLRKSEMNLIDTNQIANVAQTSNEDPGKVGKSDKSQDIKSPNQSGHMLTFPRTQSGHHNDNSDSPAAEIIGLARLVSPDIEILGESSEARVTDR